ncbi:MAG: extracellular solute-binding protein [Caldilineaceae bacterium]|nr:extracellular solute-binding protein [Caldilineaceae bacterium]
MHSTNHQRALTVLLLTLLGAYGLFGACVAPAPALDESARQSAVVQPTVISFWQSAAQPYRGLQLRGISENSPPSLYVRDVLAPAFQAETGIVVNLQISKTTAIEPIVAIGGQDYDFVYVEQDMIYSYLEKQRLVDLTTLLATHAELQSPVFNLIDFTGFIREFIEPSSGDLYAVPIEAFIKPYLYRTDLFADPALQTAFAAEYHYPLAPAITFQQYRDIAAFFTDYGERHNLALWGTTVQGTTTDVPAFYEFFETIAPGFGVYNWGINPDTYAATVGHGGQLDSKPAIDALTFWVDMLQYAPPEAPQSDWNQVAASFAHGRAAQAWVYGENMAWIATDPTRSQVVGKVGVALPPTAPGVMEAATTGAGYLGYYDGAAFGIPINSDQKAAALLWLQYLGQAAVQPNWASANGRVVHFSTFDNGLVEAQDRRLNGYYSLMKEHGNLFAGAPPFPFHAPIRDLITPYLHRAIRHELTPTEALQQAAVATEAELTRLGYRNER